MAQVNPDNSPLRASGAFCGRSNYQWQRFSRRDAGNGDCGSEGQLPPVSPMPASGEISVGVSGVNLFKNDASLFQTYRFIAERESAEGSLMEVLQHHGEETGLAGRCRQSAGTRSTGRRLYPDVSHVVSHMQACESTSFRHTHGTSVGQSGTSL